jgi:hypothetical protein
MQPLLVNQSVISIEGLGGNGDSLADYLTAMFAAILELDSQAPNSAYTLQIACSYSFPVGSAADQIYVRTPILLVPQIVYSAAAAPRVTASLATAIEDWTARNGPDPAGSYMFDVSVYAQASGATGATAPNAAALQPPMLELEQLRLGMTAIRGGEGTPRRSGGRSPGPISPSIVKGDLP